MNVNLNIVNADSLGFLTTTMATCSNTSSANKMAATISNTSSATINLFLLCGAVAECMKRHRQSATKSLRFSFKDKEKEDHTF